MSTPKGHKELWKNCKWENKEEKLAFFNHYFKNSDILAKYVKGFVEDVKESLIAFIEVDVIKEKDTERPLTKKDIIDKIKE